MGKGLTVNGNSVLIALVFSGPGTRGEFCELRLRMGLEETVIQHLNSCLRGLESY